MESPRSKLIDPNYVRLAVANLNKIQSQAAAGQCSAPAFSTTSSGKTNNDAGAASINAADLLDFLYEPIKQSTSDGTAFALQLETTRAPSTIDNASTVLPSSVIEQDETAGSTNWLTQPGAKRSTVFQQPEPSEGIALAEAATRLGLDRRTILGLITIGKLTAETDSRGQLLINRRSLETFQTAEIPSSGMGKPASCMPKLHSNTAEQQDPSVDLSVDQQTVEIASNPVRIDVPDLVARLSEAQSQLESASYRIGFLEAELATSEKKYRLLPDLKTQESRLAALERENQELRLRLEKLEASSFWNFCWSLVRHRLSPRYNRLERPEPEPLPSNLAYKRSRREFH